MKKKIFVILLILLLACGGYATYSKSILNKTIQPTQSFKISKEILDKYIIQGVVRYQDRILVSAYVENWADHPIILTYDLDGNLLYKRTLNSQSHLGSIHILDNQLYSCGIALQNGYDGYVEHKQYPSNPKIAVLETFLYKEVIQNSDTILSKNNELHFCDEKELLLSSASKINNCIVSEFDIHDYQGKACIYASNYNKKDGGHLVILPLESFTYATNKNNYRISLFNANEIQYFSLPKKQIQGICVLNDGTLLLSQSNNKMKSKIYHCKITDKKIKVIDSFYLPPHIEQISLYDDNHIIVSFEKTKEAIKIFDLSKLGIKNSND